MPPTKAELAKAYDGGQAAQQGGFSSDGCPFEPDTPEYDAWMDGFANELDEKWTSAARAITQEITN